MQVEYASGWDENSNEPVTPLNERQARDRDARGEAYTALVWEPGERRPVVVSVAWDNGSVAVEFFDDPGRVRVGYRFHRLDRRTLFLDTVRCYFYRSEDPELTRDDSHYVETSRFDPDGLLTHEAVDADAGETVTTKYQDIDLTPNWEPVPTFGDWDSITRYER